MAETRIGVVTHFFHKPMVAALKIEAGSLKVGDKIRFRGHTTDFTETVDSLQIEHESVQEVGPGALVGLRVKDRVRENDEVYKVEGE